MYLGKSEDEQPENKMSFGTALNKKSESDKNQEPKSFYESKMRHKCIKEA